MLQNKIKRFSHTSDGKRNQNNRKSVDLRNLINNDLLLENNFVSLKSERIQSSVNPTTNAKYSERLKRQLYPESAAYRRSSGSKATLHIEFMKNATTSRSTRLIRQKSQYLQSTSPKYHQHKEKYETAPMPFITKEQKISMKKALGKINLLASQQTAEQRESQSYQLQAIFTFLGCLANSQNHYTKAFDFIHEKLSSVVFFQKSTFNQSDLNDFLHVTESTSNKKIIEAVYNDPTSQRSTYRNLIMEFTREVLFKEREFKKQTEICKAQVKEFQELLAEKQALIEKISKKLKYFEVHPSANQYPQLMSLKEENKMLKGDIEEHLYQIKILNHNLDLLHENKIMLQNKIDDYKKEIIQYEIQKNSGVQEIQESSELKQFESNVGMLKEMLDRSILRMSGMKEEYDKLKNYNQELIQERSALAKRAAVGFGELTPRPQFKKICEDFNLNYKTIFNPGEDKPNSNKTVSTEKFVTSLIGKFKNYYETYQIQQKGEKGAVKYESQEVKLKEMDEVKRNKKSAENQKGMSSSKKEKDQFYKAMDDVYETKSQIKRTMIAAEQVKEAYSRQKQERKSKG